jgi:CDP-paratose synthetase
LKKHILITGINGFLGSHLAKNLKSTFEIIGLSNSNDNLFRLEEEKFKIYSSETDTLESIFLDNNIFAIIHTATVYKNIDDNVLPMFKTNIELPVNLSQLAVKYKVELFINTDTFFNNKNYKYSYLEDYTLTKRHALEWIKMLTNNSECKLVNMKLFHVYGQGDSSNKFVPYLIQNIKKNIKEFEMTPGEQTRDFIYINDVVNSFYIVLNSCFKLSSFQEFEIGSGKSYSIKEFANIIKTITKSKTDLKFGSLPYRKGEIMESQISNLDIHSLGWRPKYSLKKGLENYILKEKGNV